MSALVDQLRAYGDLHGLSNRQLSIKLGVNVSTVKKWFASGKSHEEPSPANVLKIRSLLSSDEGGLVSPYPGMFGVAKLVQSPARDTTVENDQRADEILAMRGKGVPALNKFKMLLETYKTVTDAIHGDVRLTRLEVDIIDTTEFQRLRTLKQLGTAYLTYPSAVHTRFEHCLGTLAQAEEMFRKINDDPLEEEIDEEAHVLIRLVALLHDITYGPFGHELEDEANLISKHEERYQQLLRPGTTIGNKLVEYIGPELAAEVIRTLAAHTEDEVSSLRYPFVSDIVLNTVCADLLDYLKRDNYFTGLKETFGQRFMHYLVITKVQSDSGKAKAPKRLAIKLEKKGMLRRDVMSEVTQLLRARYSLGEKVYYHPAKQITSAMVSKGVYLLGLYKDPTRLCQMGDEELILEMEKSEVTALKEIGADLRSRNLFKAVYWVGLNTARYMQPMLVKTLHENPDDRAKVEAELASYCSMTPEDIIIYCPKTEMSLKEAAVKVQWLDGTTRPLNLIGEDPPSGEVKELDAKYHALWRFCVLLRSSLVDQKGQELSDACTYHWYMLNENPQYRGFYFDQSFKALWQLALDEIIPPPEMRELLESARLDRSGAPQTVEGWREYIRSLKPQIPKSGEVDS